MNQSTYVFHLVHDFISFRLAELKSVCEVINESHCLNNCTYNDDVKYIDRLSISNINIFISINFNLNLLIIKSPLFTCELKNDDLAQQLAKRSVLLKSVSKLYFQSQTLDDLLTKIETTNTTSLKCDETFKIDVYSFGKIYSMRDKVSKIEKLIDALKFESQGAKVCLKDDKVQHRFVYFEEWIPNKTNTKITTENLDETDGPIQQETNDGEEKYLKQVYFGKFLCEGLNNQMHKYNLKDRCFIANTTMDPLLSMIMSNMAQVKENQFIYDPFVGSGSLLVAAAHFNAFVMGADLDYNLIHSRGLSSRMGQKYRKKEETIRNNLKQYGFENKYLDVFIADFSTEYIRNDFKFDAIITDPPYGIREKATKIGSKNKSNNEVKESPTNAHHLPQHTQYKLGDIFSDLLTFSAEHLNVGGRLVFWLPVYLEIDRSLYTMNEMKEILRSLIPLRNECLDLISFSEQRLTRFTSRILVCMKRNENLLVRVIKQQAKSIAITNECDHHLEQQEQPDEQQNNLNILNKFRDNYFNPRNKN